MRGSKQLATALRVTRLSGVLRRAGAWRGVVTLAYHRIGDGAGSAFDRGLWSATVDNFDAQVRFLRKHCDVIGPADVSEAVSRRRGRHALITFDDGYLDNYTAAFPILKAHGVPGVFFVSTGFIDRPRLPWWDEIAWMIRKSGRRTLRSGRWLPGGLELDETDRERPIRAALRTFKSLPGHETEGFLAFLADATEAGRYPGGAAGMWMDWDMLREMRASGMFIGGHTVNHPVLSRLSRDEQLAEVRGCGERLSRELGESLRWFSYPVGGPDAFNNATRQCLREQGVELAFTYFGSFGTFSKWDPLAVPRVAVERETTLDDLGALLALPQVFA